MACKKQPNYHAIDTLSPKSYVAQYVLNPPKIDGVIDSLEWESIEWSDSFIDIESTQVPRYETKMKMSWDKDYLYMMAQLYDDHIWGYLKQRDTVIFYNNDFEIFIDHNGDTHNYAEIELNALNTVWDLFIDKPYLNGAKVDNDWDIDGLLTGVYVDGSINDFSDKDRFWTVEIGIPWKSLKRMGFDGLAPEGRVWRMNFSRVQWQHDIVDGYYHRKKDTTGAYLREDNWVWSKQADINMHKPEYWGFVLFSKDRTIEDYEIPKDVALINWMYEVFRYSQKEKISFKSVRQYGIIDSDTILLMPFKRDDQWFLGFKSPLTNIFYSLNEWGQLKKQVRDEL